MTGVVRASEYKQTIILARAVVVHPVALRQSTGNNIMATISINFFRFFPPSSLFLKEGVLKSNILFSESYIFMNLGFILLLLVSWKYKGVPQSSDRYKLKTQLENDNTRIRLGVSTLSQVVFRLTLLVYAYNWKKIPA